MKNKNVANRTTEPPNHRTIEPSNQRIMESIKLCGHARDSARTGSETSLPKFLRIRQAPGDCDAGNSCRHADQAWRADQQVECRCENHVQASRSPSQEAVAPAQTLCGTLTSSVVKLDPSKGRLDRAKPPCPCQGNAHHDRLSVALSLAVWSCVVEMIP